MLRTIERPTNATLPAVRVGGVEHLLHAVHVRGEAGDDDPPLGAGEHPVEDGGDLALGVVNPGTSALVESTMNRSTPSVAEAGEARAGR